MPVLKTAEELVAQAMKEVVTLRADALAQQRQTGARLLLVDIRDLRELQIEGVAEGAIHAPRGMLEFWVDPRSPYHKPVFSDDGALYVLYCGLGWRSALAAKTLQDMGMTNVAHIEGGFAAMQAQGIAIKNFETWRAAK